MIEVVEVTCRKFLLTCHDRVLRCLGCAQRRTAQRSLLPAPWRVEYRNHMRNVTGPMAATAHQIQHILTLTLSLNVNVNLVFLQNENPYLTL